MFLDALCYPFRRCGVIMILLGAVFAVILDFLSNAGVFGLISSVISIGYFGAFYLDIIGGAMTGSDEIPNWPSVSSFWDDILSPVFRLVGLLAISFSPLMSVVFLAEDVPDGAYWGALVFGSLYFPVATLASLAFGNLWAALPHVVLPALFRLLPGYLLACVALAAGVILTALLQWYAAKVPYAGRFLVAAVALYALMFQGRLIGLVYRGKSEKLGWEQG